MGGVPHNASRAIRDETCSAALSSCHGQKSNAESRVTIRAQIVVQRRRFLRVVRDVHKSILSISVVGSISLLPSAPDQPQHPDRIEFLFFLWGLLRGSASLGSIYKRRTGRKTEQLSNARGLQAPAIKGAKKRAALSMLAAQLVAGPCVAKSSFKCIHYFERVD